MGSLWHRYRHLYEFLSSNKVGQIISCLYLRKFCLPNISSSGSCLWQTRQYQRWWPYQGHPLHPFCLKYQKYYQLKLYNYNYSNRNAPFPSKYDKLTKFWKETTSGKVCRWIVEGRNDTNSLCWSVGSSPFLPAVSRELSVGVRSEWKEKYCIVYIILMIIIFTVLKPGKMDKFFL